MVDALTENGDEGRGNAAISFGKLHSKRYKPEISEWGNPTEQNSVILFT